MNDLDKHAEFMEMFLSCQHDIRAFVAAGLFGWDHVDDIMIQKECIAMYWDNEWNFHI